METKKVDFSNDEVGYLKGLGYKKETTYYGSIMLTKRIGRINRRGCITVTSYFMVKNEYGFSLKARTNSDNPQIMERVTGLASAKDQTLCDFMQFAKGKSKRYKYIFMKK